MRIMTPLKGQSAIEISQKVLKLGASVLTSQQIKGDIINYMYLTMLKAIIEPFKAWSFKIGHHIEDDD